jgi:hypothetical protein
MADEVFGGYRRNNSFRLLHTAPAGCMGCAAHGGAVWLAALFAQLQWSLIERAVFRGARIICASQVSCAARRRARCAWEIPADYDDYWVFRAVAARSHAAQRLQYVDFRHLSA